MTALQTKILRADFLGTRELLRKIRDAAPRSDGEQKQVEFATRLDALETGAGPQGWVDWLLAFRNMLVHRGRRIEIGQFVPREPSLYDRHGRPILRVRVVTQLPLDPGRSDIEVFLDPAVTPVLTEDAMQTLDGLVSSVRTLVDNTGRELHDFWHWRRAHPDALAQPKSQWPSGPSVKSVGFNGYAPGSFPYTPTQLMSHPLVLRRIRAAALDDQARSQWNDFD